MEYYEGNNSSIAVELVVGVVLVLGVLFTIAGITSGTFKDVFKSEMKIRREVKEFKSKNADRESKNPPKPS
jgi:hypothetical protein